MSTLELIMMMAHPYLNTAWLAVREAAKVLTQAMNRMDRIHVVDELSLTTDMDLQLGTLITEKLKAAYGDHQVVTEEQYHAHKDLIDQYESYWLIDPIDGTRNFLKEIPFFAISVAYVEHGKVMLALVYDICHDECFIAESERGFMCNQKACACA